MQGLESRLEHLTNDYADMVYRLAWIRTKATHDAEDIVQDVFLRYLKRKPVFESSKHEKAWFVRATVNCANSFLSSARNRRTLPYEDGAGGSAADEKSGEVLAAVAPLLLAMRTLPSALF